MKPAIALVLMLGISMQASQPARTADRTPVLLELFTSEGCSSCPPADQLLMLLATQQPVPGANIIVLSEHVDYWNNLGWKDPYSSAQFTDRQNEYATALHNKDIYTPQMIVDGKTDFVGNDRSEAIQLISDASRVAKTPIRITSTKFDADNVSLQIHMDPLTAGTADVYLAITENNLSNAVTRGENQGHKLSHVAVVRKLTLLGHTTAKSAFDAAPIMRLSKEWKRADLKFLVFAQNSKSRNVVAVAW
jgi:hypothetical protein